MGVTTGTGAEVSTPLPTTYGTLVVTLDVPRELPLDVIAGVFIYRDDDDEIDLELGRWGDAGAANAQFVVQPGTGDRLHRFELPVGGSTHSIAWAPDSIRFASRAASDSIETWTFDGTPRPEPSGAYRLHLNLWFQGEHADGAPAELIVDAIQFVP